MQASQLLSSGAVDPPLGLCSLVWAASEGSLLSDVSSQLPRKTRKAAHPLPPDSLVCVL